MSSKQTKSNEERRQFWQMVIETWRDSGLSVSQFCKAEGLSEGTFYSWRKRLSVHTVQRKAPAGPNPPAFIEVAMPKPALSLSNGSDHVSLELLFSSGHTLRIRSAADNETLSNVLSVLHQVGLC
jgi:transposase-like protein